MTADQYIGDAVVPFTDHGSLMTLQEARPGGFEPPTYGLEIRCSIRLSYGRKY
jgi:hypothetical protein